MEDEAYGSRIRATKASVSFLIFFCGLACAMQDPQTASQKPESPTSAAQAQTAPAKVKVSSETMRSLLVQKVDPEYPAKAAAEKLEGPVVLSVTLGKDGSVIDVEPRKCGYALLQPAAAAAVRQWRYKQPLSHGLPVEVQGDVIVDFELPQTPGGTPRVRIDTEVAESHIESQAAAQYPPNAQLAKIQGCVVVHAEIDKAGKVKQVKAVSGHPFLLHSAEMAVLQFRYRPFEQNGVVADVDTYVIVKYALR